MDRVLKLGAWDSWGGKWEGAERFSHLDSGNPTGEVFLQENPSGAKWARASSFGDLGTWRCLFLRVSRGNLGVGSSFRPARGQNGEYSAKIALKGDFGGSGPST